MVTLIFLQGIQIAPSLISGVSITTSLAQRRPFIDTIGTTGCSMVNACYIAQNWSLIIGSCGMAGYRLASYTYAQKISECRTIVRQIHFIEGLIGLTLFVFYHHSPMSPMTNFCEGYSFEMKRVIGKVR